MNEEHSLELAESIARIIPALGKKIIRPTEQLKSVYTPLQMNTLSILAKGKSFTMSELAQEMSMSNQQMTAVINQLADKKIVSRTHDKADRRVVRISITKTGEKVLAENNKRLAKMFANQIIAYSEEDYEDLKSCLESLENILERINKYQ